MDDDAKSNGPVSDDWLPFINLASVSQQVPSSGTMTTVRRGSLSSASRLSEVFLLVWSSPCTSSLGL